MSILAGLLAVALAFSTVSSPITLPQWVPPLDSPIRIERIFDLANGEYKAGHRGVDLRAHPGNAVYAPADGIVHFAGTVVDRGVLTLRVDDRTLISLEPVRSELTEGEAVQRGQQIAVVEGTSHCGASCLHVGVRIGEQYVNPLRFFAGARPRLLPLSGQAASTG